ncbi:hypothetical protein Tco_0039634 [Tanacetum coccineum]
MKRVNTFVDYKTELVEESSKKAEIELEENIKKAKAKVMEGSSKRAGTELERDSLKSKSGNMFKNTEEKVAIDVIPLAVKPPSIVDWKIHKKGKKTYYQIIKADGSLNMYLIFNHMLKSFDREDLETLWKLVKAKHGSTRPEEGYERVLWGDLKLLMKKLEILEKNIKYQERRLMDARLLMNLEFTVAQDADLSGGRIQGIGYGVLEFLGVETTHRYALSSLMDTAYWLSE